MTPEQKAAEIVSYHVGFAAQELILGKDRLRADIAQALREARAEGMRDAAYWMDLFADQNESNGSTDRSSYLRAFAEDIRLKAERGRFRMHAGEEANEGR